MNMNGNLWMTEFLLKDEQGKRSDIERAKRFQNPELYHSIMFHLELRGQTHLLHA